MALIECYKCRNMISEEAELCHYCGAKKKIETYSQEKDLIGFSSEISKEETYNSSAKKSESWYVFIIILMILIIIMVMIVSAKVVLNDNSNSTTATDTPIRNNSEIKSISANDVEEKVILRGYRIEHGSSVQPDSGGIVARNMTVWKNGCTSSLYVELNSSGNILVWDELQIICSK